jgi:hypothetical protein
MAESRDELRALVEDFHVTLTNRWNAIRIELRFLASHRAFGASDLGALDPMIARFDDLVAALSSSENISPTIADDASSFVEADWPALLALLDRDCFFSLISPLIDRFNHHDTTFSQSIDVKRFDTETFRGFFVALLTARDRLSQSPRDIGAILTSLGFAIGSVAYFARSPELLKIDPQLPGDFVQLSDLLQLMERWAFTRTLAEQAHAELFRGFLLKFAYLRDYGCEDARTVEAANASLEAELATLRKG